ncbi:GH32 C-terminal domain-containing protein [Streptomyces sp. NPDC055089]
MGAALDTEAAFSLKDAERFGINVRTGVNGEETVIGYDTTTRELYVDRTRSGAVDFSDTFAGVQRAPLHAVNGKVKLRIGVDRCGWAGSTPRGRSVAGMEQGLVGRAPLVTVAPAACLTSAVAGWD